jgi:hypothetical protein
LERPKSLGEIEGGRTGQHRERVAAGWPLAGTGAKFSVLVAGSVRKEKMLLLLSVAVTDPRAGPEFTRTAL